MWKKEQAEIIEALKDVIIAILILIRINYNLDIEEIITTFNTSKRE